MNRFYISQLPLVQDSNTFSEHIYQQFIKNFIKQRLYAFGYLCSEIILLKGPVLYTISFQISPIKKRFPKRISFLFSRKRSRRVKLMFVLNSLKKLLKKIIYKPFKLHIQKVTILSKNATLFSNWLSHLLTSQLKKTKNELKLLTRGIKYFNYIEQKKKSFLSPLLLPSLHNSKFWLWFSKHIIKFLLTSWKQEKKKKKVLTWERRKFLLLLRLRKIRKRGFKRYKRQQGINLLYKKPWKTLWILKVRRNRKRSWHRDIEWKRIAFTQWLSSHPYLIHLLKTRGTLRQRFNKIIYKTIRYIYLENSRTGDSGLKIELRGRLRRGDRSSLMRLYAGSVKKKTLVNTMQEVKTSIPTRLGIFGLRVKTKI